MNKNVLKLLIDCKIYPLEAVKGACYTFTDTAFAEIEQISKGKLQVILTPKKESKIPAQNIRGEFLNELLHHALRLKIAKNNNSIREYIVTRALAAANPAQCGELMQHAYNKKNVVLKKKRKISKVKLSKNFKNKIEKAGLSSRKGYKKDFAGITQNWEDKHSKK